MANWLGGLLGAAGGAAGGNWLGNTLGGSSGWGDLGSTIGGTLGGYFGSGKDPMGALLGGYGGSQYGNLQNMFLENMPGMSQEKAISSTGGLGYNDGVSNVSFTNQQQPQTASYGVGNFQPSDVTVTNMGQFPGMDSGGTGAGMRLGYQPSGFMDELVSRLGSPDAAKAALGLFGLYQQDRAASEAQKRFAGQMGAYSDAQQRLQQMLNNPAMIRENPQYKAMMAESEEALKRQAAAGGQRLSGSLLNQLSQNAMRQADMLYNQEMTRLQGLGQQANQFLPAMSELDAIRKQKQLEALGMIGKGFGFF